MEKESVKECLGDYENKTELLEAIFSGEARLVTVYVDDESAEGNIAGWHYSALSGERELYVGLTQNGGNEVYISRYDEVEDKLVIVDDGFGEKVYKEWREAFEKERKKNKNVFVRIRNKLKEWFTPTENQSKKPALITLSIFYGVLFLLGGLMTMAQNIFDPWEIQRFFYKMKIPFNYETINTLNTIGMLLLCYCSSYFLYLNSHKVFKSKVGNGFLIAFGIIGYSELIILPILLLFPDLQILARSNLGDTLMLLCLFISITGIVSIVGNLYFCKGLSNTPHIILGIFAPVITALLVAFIVICYIIIWAKAVLSLVIPALKESEVGQAFLGGYYGWDSTSTQYEVWEDGYKRTLTYYGNGNEYKDDIGHYWVQNSDGTFTRQ